jgi:hypothetical protein
MNELVQRTVLVGLVKRLADKGSWAGETHVQKAAYLLAELRNIDFNFDFILYKYGPYSFGLHDELATMCADDLMERFLPDPRYGPQLLVRPGGVRLEQRLRTAAQRYGEALDWITDILAGRGVADLERLATAMWMTRQDPDGSVQSRAQGVVDVKRHISLDDAVGSVEEIDRLLDESALDHPQR